MTDANPFKSADPRFPDPSRLLRRKVGKLGKRSIAGAITSI